METDFAATTSATTSATLSEMVHPHVSAAFTNSGNSLEDYVSAFNVYGIMAAVFAPTLPFLWRYWLRQTSDLNTAGYKLAAYSHLVTWTPFLFTWVMHLIFKANFTLSWCNWAMKVTFAGPWFFQIYAIYVMALTGLTKLNAAQWAGFFTFLVYNGGQMFL